MEQRRAEPNDPNAGRIRRGWSFGAEDFIARLLDRIPGSVSEHHQGREWSETDEQKSRSHYLRTAHEAWLGKKRTCGKSDPQKVALARVVRAQTPMSLKWIARRLDMGSWTHVSNLLRQ
jgi:hypothetical protein